MPGRPIPTGLVLLALLVGPVTACSRRASPSGHRLASELSFRSALVHHSVEFRGIEMGAVARPALVPFAHPGRWPPVFEFRSGPLRVDRDTLLETGVGMKTYGLKIAEGDRPVFRLEARGPRGTATLLEKTGVVDFPPDRWLPVRLSIPAALGSPVTITFTVRYSSDLEADAPKATAAWAVPQVLRRTPTHLPNVLLVIFDTLRADRTGLYDDTHDTTPFLDELSSRGVTLQHVIAPYPSTLTSHWSLFTGLDPPRHGAYPGSKKRPDVATLAEMLKGAGYLTAAFTEGGYVNSYFGFARGFDLYHNGPDAGTDRFTGAAPDTFDLASQWISERRDSRFFLFLHTYQVHAPYDPPEQYRKRFDGDYRGRWARAYPVEASFEINNGKLALTPSEITHIGNLYEAEIRYLDDSFASFWHRLEQWNLLEDTLVVITSDHGEDLMEHGWIHHGTTLYEPALEVPFLAIWPGTIAAARRLDCQRPLVDILPTVLDLLGIPEASRIDGKSFADSLRQGQCAETRPAFAELENPVYKRHADLPIASVRDGDWKLIAHLRSGNLELYDLSSDPGESTNLADREPTRATRMRRQIGSYLEGGASAAGAERELSPAIEEKLRGLGYLE